MKTVPLMAFSFAVAEFGVVLWTWFIAFFNPEHNVMVYINRAGEMDFELVVLPIVFVFCLVCLANEWKKWVKNE
jgi:hypothetical protein